MAIIDPAITRASVVSLPKPKILSIIGSSTSEGSGATGGNGWCQQLQTKLASRGWTTINRSVSGTTTTWLLAQLQARVLANRPSAALFAFSFGSDVIESESAGEGLSRKQIWDRFISRLVYVADECRKRNIVPVFAGQQPRVTYTSDLYALVRTWEATAETLGLITVNGLDGLDDGSGQYTANTSADLTHPNDLGHQMQLEACPVSIFDLALRAPEMLPAPQPERGCFQINGQDNPLQATFTDPLGSFTVGFFALNTNVGASMWGVNSPTGATRVRSVAGTGAFYGLLTDLSVEIASAVPNSDKALHHHAIRYSRSTGKISYFIDGVKIGEADTSFADPITGMSFGDRWTGTLPSAGWVGGITVHRYPLRDSAVSLLASGVIPKASLDLYCPLDDSVALSGSRPKNYAPTESYLECVATNIVPRSIPPKSAYVPAEVKMTTAAAAPTAADIPAGEFRVWKDTGGGTTKLYVNDGGTIRSVALT